MAQWTETNAANKRAGHCQFCETAIPAGAGLLIWHYGEQDFEDSDGCAKPLPKIWSVRCVDVAGCKRRYAVAHAEWAVPAAEESLRLVIYGDWMDGQQEEARVERQQRLAAAQARLAELTATV